MSTLYLLRVFESCLKETVNLEKKKMFVCQSRDLDCFNYEIIMSAWKRDTSEY